MSNSKITSFILLIIMIYIGGYFLIQNSVKDMRTDMIGLLDNITSSAEKGNWERTNNELEELEKTWGKRKYFISLNYAEPDYLLFIEYLGRLKGAVDERELIEIKSNVLVMKDLWENFTKLVPVP